MTKKLFSLLSLLFLAAPLLRSAEDDEWLDILQVGLKSEYSQQRHDALKQVDTSTAKGIRVLFKVLESTANHKDPLVFDWYFREAAYEALARIELPGEGAGGPPATASGGATVTEEQREELKEKREVEEAIRDLLEGKGKSLAKEAVVYSVIWKIRKDFVKEYGGIDDRKIQEAKHLLRKTRGLEYFQLMLPRLEKFDPQGKRYEWIRLAFQDADTRVRQAALHAFLVYPKDETIPLLIENLEKLGKSRSTKARNYKEWLLTRFVLEQLSGQYYGDSVADWKQWWTVAKDHFSLAKRVEEEASDDETSSKTVVVRRDGVEVAVNMKIAGKPDGYPLVVLPWQGYEPDYFRPYFHGIEDLLRVYYLFMPQLEDFKGLVRGEADNLVRYPTKRLADAVAEYMKETDLEQFAVMGHGPGASVLAMHLAASYADQVSHLVLINPRSAGDQYRAAMDNVQRLGRARGNREVDKGIDWKTIKQNGELVYEPADSAETGGLGRALGNLHFADPTTPEIGSMKFLYTLPGGTNVMNDSEWSIKGLFPEGPPAIPVMIMMGEQDPWTPAPDMLRVVKFFGRPYVARFKNSSEMPFLSETYLFTRHLQNFFKKFPPPEEKAPTGKN